MTPPAGSFFHAETQSQHPRERYLSVLGATAFTWVLLDDRNFDELLQPKHFSPALG
jgi:hypothetical protein